MDKTVDFIGFYQFSIAMFTALFVGRLEECTKSPCFLGFWRLCCRRTVKSVLNTGVYSVLYLAIVKQLAC